MRIFSLSSSPRSLRNDSSTSGRSEGGWRSCQGAEGKNCPTFNQYQRWRRLSSSCFANRAHTMIASDPTWVGAQEEKADKAVIEQAVQALKQLKIELDAAVKVAVDASQKEAKDKCAPLRAHRAQHCQHTLQRALKTPNMRCCLSTGRRSARSSPRCWSIECSTCRPSKSMVASPGCTITAPLAAP